MNYLDIDADDDIELLHKAWLTDIQILQVQLRRNTNGRGKRVLLRPDIVRYQLHCVWTVHVCMCLSGRRLQGVLINTCASPPPTWNIYQEQL